MLPRALAKERAEVNLKERGIWFESKCKSEQGFGLHRSSWDWKAQPRDYGIEEQRYCTSLQAAKPSEGICLFIFQLFINMFIHVYSEAASLGSPKGSARTTLSQIQTRRSAETPSVNDITLSCLIAAAVDVRYSPCSDGSVHSSCGVPQQPPWATEICPRVVKSHTWETDICNWKNFLFGQPLKKKGFILRSFSLA